MGCSLNAYNHVSLGTVDQYFPKCQASLIGEGKAWILLILSSLNFSLGLSLSLFFLINDSNTQKKIICGRELNWSWTCQRKSKILWNKLTSFCSCCSVSCRWRACCSFSCSNVLRVETSSSRVPIQQLERSNQNRVSINSNYGFRGLHSLYGSMYCWRLKGRPLEECTYRM